MKTTFNYDHYWLYEEIVSAFAQFAESYPDLCRVESLCKTEENRDVLAITITNFKNGEALEKPAFHIDGNTHAGEVTGSMTALHTADILLTNYGEDPEITWILDHLSVYVVPRVSPDGAEMYLTSPYTLRSVNRVHNPKVGGVKEEDLDEDGVIRMMRIPTPYGAWKKDPEDPDTVKERKPSDVEGEFFDIYPEGVLEAYDGDENLKLKSSEWSLDFNRNYPYGWFPENRQRGAGKYPLSNPETKAMADWIIEHPNIFGVSTNHTSGGLLLYPPGTRKESTISSLDREAFKQIAKMGEEILGYKPMNIYDSFISDQDNYDSGAFDDWCYQSQGILAFTVELWDLANKVGVPYEWNKEESTDTEMKRFNACLKWVKENAPEAFVSWKPYHHPVFGDVEIGGFNYKFTHQNPPVHMLQEVCEKMSKFMLAFMKTAPRVHIESLEKEKVSKGVYKLTAVIGNLGYLPTNVSDEASKLGIAKPVKVVLDSNHIISGKKEEEIKSLEGFSATERGMFYGNLSTFRNAKARKKLSWVIEGQKGEVITLKVTSEKAGQAEAQIVL